jgi:FMN-dependent NADH-azoreductase
MPSLLHIDSSPRSRSHSRSLTGLFVDLWVRRFPDTEIVTRDLGVFTAPHITEAWIAAAFCQPDQRGSSMRKALEVSDLLVDELLRADMLLFGVPMYNFGLPSMLKAYFDNIVRVNRTFLFEPDDHGNPYKPLVQNKSAYVIVTSGDSGYQGDGPLWHLNHVEPHLRTILGFIGIGHVEFAYSGNDEFGGEQLERSLSSAREKIKHLVETAEARCPHQLLPKD